MEAGLLPTAQSEERDQLVHWAGTGQNPAGRVVVWHCSQSRGLLGRGEASVAEQSLQGSWEGSPVLSTPHFQGDSESNHSSCHLSQLVPSPDGRSQDLLHTPLPTPAAICRTKDRNVRSAQALMQEGEWWNSRPRQTAVGKRRLPHLSAPCLTTGPWRGRQACTEPLVAPQLPPLPAVHQFAREARPGAQGKTMWKEPHVPLCLIPRMLSLSRSGPEPQELRTMVT